MADEQRPLIFRVGSTRIELWPEERAMLRDLAAIGRYATAYSKTMQYLQSTGAFSRLEECGPNGTAVATDLGKILFKRIEASRHPQQGQ